MVSLDMARTNIIIPLYNKGQCIERAIRSIQNQTVEDWRLIVVDDGSTDDGPEQVRKINDDRISMIHQENKGPGAARNAGIAQATSKYLAFLDADDEWYPWYLENALNAIESNDVALVGTMYYEWPKKIDMTQHWSKLNVHPGQYRLTGNENPIDVKYLMFFFHVGNSLMSTAVAQKHGGFYDQDRCCHAEDTTFFINIVLNETLQIIGPPAVCHHREDSSLSIHHHHSLAPFMLKPEIILRNCPASHLPLAKNILAAMALHMAYHRARHGLKSDAIELLERFPQARQYKLQYWRCRYTIALSRWFPYWVRLKCVLGPPVRMGFKKLCWKLRLKPKPPTMANETNAHG